MAEVYLILGAEGAGRREVVRDLAEGGLDDDETAVIARHESEPDQPVDEQLTARPGNTVVPYANLSTLAWPGDPDVAFVIAPGRGNPADAVEAFHAWLKSSGQLLGRVITVVHCALLAAHPKLRTWHRACFHFSDVLLLNRREGVPNKWFSEFQEWLDEDRHPGIVERVKKGRLANPPLVLEPQPRRLSLLFDDDLDAIDFLEFDEDNLPEETIDLTRPADPWLARLPSGQRERPLPNISDFLA